MTERRRASRRTSARAAVLPALVMGLMGLCSAGEPQPVRRVFPTSRFAMDAILYRPYTPEVPFGSTGRRLWATSPQGWAFGGDIHYLGLTNLAAYDLWVRTPAGRRLEPLQADAYPSHVHLEGVQPAPPLTASASFTYAIDGVERPLGEPFQPQKRWTCWSSGRRQDW